jgi:hypothetical protein
MAIQVCGTLGGKLPVEISIIGEAPDGGSSDEAAENDEESPGAAMILFVHLFLQERRFAGNMRGANRSPKAGCCRQVVYRALAGRNGKIAD